MIDRFKDNIKDLLLNYYSSTDNGNSHVLCTTDEIYKKIIGIIPKGPVSECDIYNIMIELNFQKTIRKKYKKKKLISEIYCWKMYPK